MSILLWIQADSRWRLLKSTPQPPCSACRLMGDVDAARLQSVRAAGGTGYIYTNSDLFVLHARIICDIVLQICITRIHWRIYNKLHIFVNHFYFNGQQF